MGDQKDKIVVIDLETLNVFQTYSEAVAEGYKRAIEIIGHKSLILRAD